MPTEKQNQVKGRQIVGQAIQHKSHVKGLILAWTLQDSWSMLTINLLAHYLLHFWHRVHPITIWQQQQTSLCRKSWYMCWWTIPGTPFFLFLTKTAKYPSRDFLYSKKRASKKACSTGVRVTCMRIILGRFSGGEWPWAWAEETVVTSPLQQSHSPAYSFLVLSLWLYYIIMYIII